MAFLKVFNLDLLWLAWRHLCVWVLYLKDVILWCQVKQFPSHVKGDDRQRGNLLTVDVVLEGRRGDAAERCV